MRDAGVVDEAVEAAVGARRRSARRRRRSAPASVTSRISGASRSEPASRSASASSSRRTPAKTRQPAASRRSAVARPIPVEAPVTRAERTRARLQRAPRRDAAHSRRSSDRRNVVAIGNDDAERKQVTVLFADVSGSMDLAEQQDPEEWRKIMQRFFSILADAVDQLRGDGRQIHRRRDHGRLRRADRPRGPRAARLLRRPADARRRLRVRGRAAARRRASTSRPGSGSTPARWSPGAIGGARRRLHGDRPHGRPGAADGGAGRAGQGLPDRAHRRRWRAGFLDLEDLGEFEIKGASRPVRVFELAGVGEARSRLDLSRERGFSRFVGRDARRWRVLRGGAASSAEAGDGAARRHRRRTRASARAGSATSSPQRCRERGVEVFEAQAQAHGQLDPVHAGAADAARLLRDRRARARAAGAGEDRRPRAAARPRLRRGPAAASSTSSASPIPTGRCRR